MVTKKNEKSSSRRIAIAALAMCAVMGLSTVCAYFTDTSSAVNEFTVGQVSIDLEEPSWDPDNPPTDVPPGEEMEKDPQVANTGKNDAYIFASVAVPKDTFIIAEDDGTRINAEPTLQELLLVKSGDGDYAYLTEGYNSDDWTLLTDYTDTTSSDEYNFYVFGYNEILAKGETTTTLFDSIKLVNAVEGYIDLNSYEMDITAYAIQSDNIPAETATTLSEKYHSFLSRDEHFILHFKLLLFFVIKMLLNEVKEKENKKYDITIRDDEQMIIIDGFELYVFVIFVRSNAFGICIILLNEMIIISLLVFLKL